MLGLMKPWQGGAHLRTPMARARDAGYTPQSELVDWSFR
jgi:ABC-type Mn2+/Zn2+ transport system ATPase subunit